MKKTEKELCLFARLVINYAIEMYKLVDDCLTIMWDEAVRLEIPDRSDMDYLLDKLEKLEFYARTLVDTCDVFTDVLREFEDEQTPDKTENNQKEEE